MPHFEPVTLPLQWADKKGRLWHLTLRLELVAGRLECTRLTVEGVPGTPTAITTSILRGLPLARLVDQLRDEHVGSLEWLGSNTQTWKEGGRAEEAQDVAVLRAAKRTAPGRPKMYDEDHYRRVAAVYSAARVPRGHPVNAVAEEFVVAKTTAAKWIQRARKQGFLPPTTPGKAAGSADDR